MTADRALASAIRSGLQAAADPQRAAQMRTYLKSELPCLGVPIPRVRAVVRAAASARPPTSGDTLRDTVLVLWRGADHRELRHAATELTGTPAGRRLQTPALLPMYEEMIVTGAWWDHVDALSHRVGALLLAAPDEIRPAVRAWQRSPDRWLRRSSIICQLDAREHTDLALLTESVLAAAGEQDFFLRKAIGWALREYAYTDPDWVRAFVAQHADRLSPLSKREALKRL